MKIVLLTGGAGYIGSHTYLELIKAKYQPIIIDNFSNSYISTIKKLEILTKQKVVFIKGDVTDYKFFVFNRWGELVYESYLPGEGWDGTFKGELVQQDAYVWKLVLTDEAFGNFHEYVGHVLVVR